MDRTVDRAAPLAVLAGAVALFVSLFLRYYEVPHGGSTFTGWESFSTADILLTIAAAAGVAGLALATATRTRWPYLGVAVAGALAMAVVVYVASRPPAASLAKAAGGGVPLVLAYGAFVGLAGAMVMVIGALWCGVLVAPVAVPAATPAPPAPAPPPPPPAP